MDVEAFKRQLSEYVEGGLPESERQRMVEAISQDPRLAAAHDQMVALRGRLASLPELKPSAGFEFALRSRILVEAANQPTASSRVQQVLFPTVRRAVAVTAIAASLALGFTYFLSQDDATINQVAGVEESTLLDPEVAAHVYGSLIREVATLPVQPVDRGALRQLSQAESFALSGRLYRRESSQPVGSLQLPNGAAKAIRAQTGVRVPVSF